MRHVRFPSDNGWRDVRGAYFSGAVIDYQKIQVVRVLHPFFLIFKLDETAGSVLLFSYICAAHKNNLILQ